MIGDTDRHRNQWDWAHDAQDGPLRARCRATATSPSSKFDGFLLKFARQENPHLADFEDRYPGTLSLAWQARRVDRRYLSDLDWAAWQPVVDVAAGAA